MLVGIHESLKMWTGIPELGMEQPEAEYLAAMGGKVARWYKLPGIAEKTIDWTNFIIALNVVYAPRVGAIGKRWKEEQAERIRKAREAAMNRGVPPSAVPRPVQTAERGPGPGVNGSQAPGGPAPGPGAQNGSGASARTSPHPFANPAVDIGDGRDLRMTAPGEIAN